jgi:transposase-like protein
MYALGLTTHQIQDHLKDIYAADVSPELISRETKDRKAVYTTNAIESANFTIQKIIRHRQSFPNNETAMKLIFMDLKIYQKMNNAP